jgi:hypothetical protein
MNTKVRIIFVISFFITILIPDLFFGKSETKTYEITGNTYSNYVIGFQITIPEGWKYYKNKLGEAIIGFEKQISNKVEIFSAIVVKPQNEKYEYNYEVEATKEFIGQQKEEREWYKEQLNKPQDKKTVGSVSYIEKIIETNSFMITNDNKMDKWFYVKLSGFNMSITNGKITTKNFIMSDYNNFYYGNKKHPSIEFLISFGIYSNEQLYNKDIDSILKSFKRISLEEKRKHWERLINEGVIDRNQHDMNFIKWALEEWYVD